MTNELKQTIKEYISSNVLYEKKTLELIEKSIWDLINLIPDEWMVSYVPYSNKNRLNVGNSVAFLFVSSKTKETVLFSVGLNIEENI